MGGEFKKADPAPEGGEVTAAARALLDACIADFGDPKDFPDDDGWVASGDKGDSVVTFKHMRDLQAALRAQPPAREDAQPVAWTDSKSLSRIVTWQGGFRGYIYGISSPTHPIGLYTHPAPDALRVAVEALKTSRENIIGWFEAIDDEVRVEHEMHVSLKDDLDVIDQALATLQAEQDSKS